MSESLEEKRRKATTKDSNRSIYDDCVESGKIKNKYFRENPISYLVR
jgi:hypothetical protein